MTSQGSLWYLDARTKGKKKGEAISEPPSRELSPFEPVLEDFDFSEEDMEEEDGGVPLATVEFGAAMLCIVAGSWEYWQGYRDLKCQRAFLVGPK